MNFHGATLQLSAALRPALDLPACDEVAHIDEDLVEYAIRRHRVGLLLHEALNKNLAAADTQADCASRLHAACQHERKKLLQHKSTEMRVTSLLEKAGIAFWALKGAGLACQLYRDAAVRSSRDLDILVRPEQAKAVIQAFNEAGYVHHAYSLRPQRFIKPVRQHREMCLHKDITFIDPVMKVPIEVHQRLFTFEPKDLTAEFTRSNYNSRIPSLSNDHYCLYIILHGAISFWHRLKWVADLSLLLRAIEPCRIAQLMALARRYNCGHAVISSAMLAEKVFPQSLDSQWAEIVSAEASHPDVQALLTNYWYTLTAQDIHYWSLPFKAFMSSGTADLVFSGRIPFFPSFIHRWRRSLARRT